MIKDDDNEIKKKISSKPKKLPLPIKLGVGAIAGIIGTTCIFPIDLIKTRLQAATSSTNPIKIFQNIIANEGGIKALYRGLGPNLIGVTPEKAIKLAANELFREYFEKEDGSIEVYQEVLAGGGAGFCQVIATNPMEITKIQMQMQALLPQAERQSATQVVKTLGLKGLYTGTMATLSRDVPFSVLFFPAYANIKKYFADENGNNSLGTTLISGGVAGAIAAGAVTPSDVIKTRLQMKGGKEKYQSMGNALRKILNEEGVGALYKGAIPRMAVVGPLFAITLVCFEQQKNYMISKGLL